VTNFRLSFGHCASELDPLLQENDSPENPPDEQ
jgi:hypothetical protein